MKTGLAVFGLAFGVLLILDGIFGWGLVKVVADAPGSSNRTYVRVSEIIVGAIFVLLAVLTLAGVM